MTTAPHLSRQLIFAHRDGFERTAARPSVTAALQPERGTSACGRFLDVVLCPVRTCVSNWCTFLACCPCLLSSAMCMNDN